jgi:hypothetical protein
MRNSVCSARQQKGGWPCLRDYSVSANWPPPTSVCRSLSRWDEVIDVVSKPVVGKELLEGRYDSGLTHMEHFEEHRDKLRLDLDIGEIDTTWLVYGTKKRFRGEVIGIPSREILAG